MPPLPKRRISKARQGERQAHLHMALPSLDVCPQCHNAKLSHHVCPTCGTYAGRQAVEVKTKKKTTS